MSMDELLVSRSPQGGEAMEAAGDIDAAIELMRMAVVWNWRGTSKSGEALDYLQRLLESKQNDEIISKHVTKRKKM